MIIAFTGKMGAGKSTAVALVNSLMPPAVNVKLADPLYDIQEYIYNKIAPVHTRGEDFIKDRKLLQWIGTEWGRDVIRPTIWTELWVSRVTDVMLEYPFDSIITCDDVRYDEEAQAVKDLGGRIVYIGSHIDRIKSLSDSIQHKSERGISLKYIDYVIDNNGSLEDLRQSIVDLLEACKSHAPTVQTVNNQENTYGI